MRIMGFLIEIYLEKQEYEYKMAEHIQSLARSILCERKDIQECE